jgi:hypothetical protein
VPALTDFLIASFHLSESPLFRGLAIELSRDGNSDVLWTFAIARQAVDNRSHSSHLPVMAVLLSVLDDLRGIKAILPLFAQLDQPMLNAAERSQFNFDQDLLPNLLNLFDVVFMRSVPDEVAFHEMRDFQEFLQC